MRSLFVQRLIPCVVLTAWILAAVLCFFFMPLVLWKNIAVSGLTTVLAFVVGAILIRIMRPFPIINPDSFPNEEEIWNLEKAYLHATKVVIWAGSAAGTMLILMLIIATAEETLTAIPILWQRLDNILSAVVGFLALFLVCKIYYFVQLDLDIVRRQADGVRQGFRKKQKIVREQQEAIRKQNDDLKDSFEDRAPYPGRKDTA